MRDGIIPHHRFGTGHYFLDQPAVERLLTIQRTWPTLAQVADNAGLSIEGLRQNLKRRGYHAFRIGGTYIEPAQAQEIIDYMMRPKALSTRQRLRRKTQE